VDDIRLMHMVDSTDDLEHEPIYVLVRQNLVGVDHMFQIGLHQLKHEVQIFEIGRVIGLDDVQKLDDVFVLEKFLYSPQ
jgi:hypothetical protein